MDNNQRELDLNNAQFWDELCGSGLAQRLGITTVTPDSLQLFDQAYMKMYPYLAGYVLREKLRDKKVLEIGLGYGTLGYFLASQKCNYYGLDIAEGPVNMMHYRLSILGQKDDDKVKQGSALEIPFPDAEFDYVYSIGCLHHTGNIPRAVSEVYRVLKPGGKAIIMLYNRHSFRQIVRVSWLRLRYLFSSRERRVVLEQQIRGLYDTNIAGESAPHTDFVSRSQVRQLFSGFSHVRVDIQNFDTYVFARDILIVRREWLLRNLARVFGLDLYIVATK